MYANVHQSTCTTLRNYYFTINNKSAWSKEIFQLPMLPQSFLICLLVHGILWLRYQKSIHGLKEIWISSIWNSGIYFVTGFSLKHQWKISHKEIDMYSWKSLKECVYSTHLILILIFIIRVYVFRILSWNKQKFLVIILYLFIIT